MDTHITSAPDLDGAGAPLGSPVRLPGERRTLPHFELQDGIFEDNREHDVRPASDKPLAGERRDRVLPDTAPHSRRRVLLATAAIVVLLAGAGGTLWLQRKGALNLPLPASITAMPETGRVASNGQTISEVGGPAVPLHPASATAAASASPSLSLPRATPPDTTELAALKPLNGPTEVGAWGNGRSTAMPDDAPAAPPLTPASSTLVEAGKSVVLAATAAVGPAIAVTLPAAAAAASAAIPVPAPGAASASDLVPTAGAAVGPDVGPATPAALAPASVPAPKPRDPIQTAIELRAEPLAPKQQVEAVGLVRELGTQLKDTRLTVAQLSATVAGLKQQLEARTIEFDSRLTLAEAGTVLAESAKAGGAAQPLTRVQPTVAARVLAASRSAAPALPPGAATAAHTVRDFRIQGASPGLAVLNVLNPAAGDAPVLYLALGDQVPGLGRIKTIYQRGTSWVVQTDNGVIQ